MMRERGVAVVKQGCAHGRAAPELHSRRAPVGHATPRPAAACLPTAIILPLRSLGHYAVAALSLPSAPDSRSMQSERESRAGPSRPPALPEALSAFRIPSLPSLHAASSASRTGVPSSRMAPSEHPRASALSDGRAAGQPASRPISAARSLASSSSANAGPLLKRRVDSNDSSSTSLLAPRNKRPGSARASTATRPVTGNSARPTTARPTTAASTLGGLPANAWICAVLENRGTGREVGIAMMEKETGHCILTQASLSLLPASGALAHARRCRRSCMPLVEHSLPTHK
jgi:hypothetical protein